MKIEWKQNSDEDWSANIGRWHVNIELFEGAYYWSAELMSDEYVYSGLYDFQDNTPYETFGVCCRVAQRWADLICGRFAVTEHEKHCQTF